MDSAVGHGLISSTACRVFPGGDADTCSLHWQVDSYPWTTREVQVLAFLKACTEFEQAGPLHIQRKIEASDPWLSMLWYKV